jgi:hypothetical protein
MTDPYNPLSKLNLARSIEGEILSRNLLELGRLDAFQGAGIYALYYAGDLEFYRPLKESLSTDNPTPIYVGKAIPKGGRTGGLRTAEIRTTALSSRLRKHANSISAAPSLRIADFLTRFLVVDDVWIPLGENMLIESYQPVWNKVIAGFGNNPLGSGRVNQRVSLWDILHPGRIRDVDANRQMTTQTELIERVGGFLRGETVPEVDSRDPEDGDDIDETPAS